MRLNPLEYEKVEGSGVLCVVCLVPRVRPELSCLLVNDEPNAELTHHIMGSCTWNLAVASE